MELKPFLQDYTDYTAYVIIKMSLIKFNHSVST